MIMKKLTENKGIFGAVAVFILVIFLYNVFFKTDSDVAPSELEATSIGDDLLKIHADLQKVTFDQALFTSPSYVGLTDFGVSIPEQAVGRSNPFDIIGRD